MELAGPPPSPLKTSSKELQKFIHYINELGMSAHSQARMLSGLKAFFKYLVYEDLIDHNPAAMLEGPKLGRKLPDTLAYSEIVRLFDAIDLSSPEGARNRAMLETLYSSGLRVSELVELRLTNIYFDIGFLRVIGKGNKERLVPIGRDALKYLKIYSEEVRIHVRVRKGFESYAFLNRRGGKLSRVMVFLVIKSLVEKIGLRK